MNGHEPEKVFSQILSGTNTMVPGLKVSPYWYMALL